MILAELKSATAELHTRTERALPSLAGMATRAGYIHCLVVLRGFHASWEPASWNTAGVEDAGFQHHDREKLSLLERDLEFLGVGEFERTVSAPRPQIDCCAAALGALYVLEGATLGGQVIERHASRSVGVTPASGGAYFHGYGIRTGDMWRSFGDTLAKWVDRNGQSESIVMGAVDCFRSLEAWAAHSSLAGATHE